MWSALSCDFYFFFLIWWIFWKLREVRAVCWGSHVRRSGQVLEARTSTPTINIWRWKKIRTLSAALPAVFSWKRERGAGERGGGAREMERGREREQEWKREGKRGRDKERVMERKRESKNGRERRRKERSCKRWVSQVVYWIYIIYISLCASSWITSKESLKLTD